MAELGAAAVLNDALFDTYHPHMFDLAVLSAPGPEDDNAEPHSQAISSPHAPDPRRGSLGRLSNLPVELLNEIVRFCTLRSVINFGYVCRHAWRIVEESYPYKLLVSAAPELVATLIQTDAALYYTVDDIFNVLRTPSCCICGNFGGFLYLPDCKRCCMRCLRFSGRLYPMTLPMAKDIFGLTKSQLKRAGVPLVRSLPGKRTVYAPSGGTSTGVSRKRFTFISESAARQIAERHHGGAEGLQAYITARPSDARTSYKSRRAMTEQEDGRDIYLPSQYHPKADHISRFLAATHLPHLSACSPNLVVERGLSCKGCQIAHTKMCWETHLGYWGVKEREIDARRERLYTRAQFLVHLETCEEAKAILAENVGV